MQEIRSLLMLGIGKLSTDRYIRTVTLQLSAHAMQMQQTVEKRERERESNLSSVFKCDLNANNGIMHPGILFLSYMTEILKISQDEVTREEFPIALSLAYACLLSISKGYKCLLNIGKV